MERLSYQAKVSTEETREVKIDMKKKKYSLKKYTDMHDEVVVVGKDGTEVSVKTHIPYSEKINYAMEYVVSSLIVKNDEYCYMSYEEDVNDISLIAKYYTNINTENVDRYELADFFVNNGIYDDIYKIIEHDMDFVDVICDRLKESIERSVKEQNNIYAFLKNNVGPIFDGNSIAQTLSETEGVSDTLFKAIGALREKEEYETGIESGKIKANGVVLDMRKK